MRKKPGEECSGLHRHNMFAATNECHAKQTPPVHARSALRHKWKAAHTALGCNNITKRKVCVDNNK